MSKSDLVFENIHYQPTVLSNEAWDRFRKQDFDIPVEWLERGERNSLDRAKLLAKDIKKPGTVFDIGCNIGFFTHVLQSLGNKATGIDNDIHVDVKGFTKKSSIQTAKQLNKKYNMDAEFIEGDFIDFLRGTDRTWDYVLFLSVFHHLFIGYGYSDYRKVDPADAVRVLQLIDEHTDQALYFEMDEKVGHPFGWGSTEEVIENIKMFTTFDKIDILDVSQDAWAEGRTLLRCSRKKNNKRILPELLSLSSLSRRNRVGCIKDGGLYLSREANDWSKDTHPYGVTIKRQSELKSGEALELIKKHPHKNIARILDFNTYWVKLEYIDGLLLSTLAPYADNSQDYLSRGVSLDTSIQIVYDLYSAIRHLHKIRVVHTDPISFNVMVTKDGTPKFIDMVGAIRATDKLIELDQEVFWKRCAMEIIDRAKYIYLDETSDKKMLELAWGNSKQVQELYEEGKVKTEQVLELSEVLKEKDNTINQYDELHKLRIIKSARKLVGASRRMHSLASQSKRKTTDLAIAVIPAPIKKALKKVKNSNRTRARGDKLK